MTTSQTDQAALREQVRARYAAAAKLTSGDCGCGQPADCGCDSGCCGGAATAEEPGFGAELYAALDRDQLPDTALLATSPDPVCVCEFTGPLGLSQPTVSHHLKKLVAAGLLEREQRGTWAYYSLRPDALGGLAAALDLQGASR